MAAQDRNPPKWVVSMSDGCSGVRDFGFRRACINHDKAYHEGGGVEDKLIADGALYADMCEPKVVGKFWSWMGRHGWARTRYTGVRFTTYNYPPGHPQRSGIAIEAFNWLGKGPV